MAKLQYWVDLKNGPGTGGTRLRLWDQLFLDGVAFPGLCQLEGGVKINFDTPTVKDPNSAPTDPRYINKLLYKGFDPGRITANLLIFDPFDWADFQDVFARFVPQKTTTLQRPFGIRHPTAEFLKISKVSIVGVSVPQIVEQTLTVRLSLVQWFPPAPLFISKFQNVGSNAVPPSTVKGPSGSGN